MNTGSSSHRGEQWGFVDARGWRVPQDRLRYNFIKSLEWVSNEDLIEDGDAMRGWGWGFVWLRVGEQVALEWTLLTHHTQCADFKETGDENYWRDEWSLARKGGDQTVLVSWSSFVLHGFDFIPLTIYILCVQLSSSYWLSILLHTRDVTDSIPVGWYLNNPLARLVSVLLWQHVAVSWVLSLDAWTKVHKFWYSAF